MKSLVKYIKYPSLSKYFSYTFKKLTIKKLPIKKVVNYCNIWITKNF